MKKNRIWHILILIIFLIFLDGYLLYAMVISDSEAPVVVCDSQEITVSVTASDDQLLAGVTASDNRDGDMTDDVVVENISAFAGDERIITYAAVDKKGNVGRAQRVLKYTDYEKPRFGLDAPLRFSIGNSPDLMQNVTASSTLDGDLTGKVKYSMTSVMDTSSEGTYEVEYRVSDSTGNVSYLPVTIELYNPVNEQGTVKLSKYLVYVKQGSNFRARSYFKDSDIDGSLDIESNVNTDKEGVYTVDYIVTDEERTGKSRLVVVVDGN